MPQVIFIRYEPVCPVLIYDLVGYGMSLIA